MDDFDFLNMLVGGPWYDHLAWRTLVRDHIAGIRHIDPQQWQGWPRLCFGSNGYYFDGVNERYTFS